MCIANKCLDAYGKELGRNPKDDYEDKKKDDVEEIDPKGIYPSKLFTPPKTR